MGPRYASIEVISLGGTIAMPQSGEPTRPGVAPTLTGNDLLGAIPSLSASGIEVNVTQFRQLAGSSLNLSDMAELSMLVEKTIADGASGVVIAQGTDTIEETAFFLDLLHSSTAPVVVTGAMRNPTIVGADGPANLLAAIQVAASSLATGLGCLVVMNDEVHAARYVQKTHANSTAAFNSPDSGPVGRIVENRLILNASPLGRISLGLEPPIDSVIRVRLYLASLGDDAAELDHVTPSTSGLVLAGFGGGHVHPSAVARIERAAKRMPVILTSRTGSGMALTSTYGFPGSESDLLSRGLISGGSLNPLKARILLYLMLSAGATRSAISTAFESATLAPLRPLTDTVTGLTVTWRPSS